MNRYRHGEHHNEDPQTAPENTTGAWDQSVPPSPAGETEWDMDPEIYMYMNDDPDTADWAEELPPLPPKEEAPPVPQSYVQQSEQAPVLEYYSALQVQPSTEIENPALYNEYIPPEPVQTYAPPPIPVKQAKQRPVKIKTKRKAPIKIAPKRLIVPSIALMLLCGTVYGGMQIPEIVKSKLTGTLKTAGFPDAKIGNVSLALNGITASDITLDKSGYDQIKTLQVQTNIAAFLFADKISALKIENVHIARTQGTAETSLRQFVVRLLDLPHYRVTVSNVTLDLGTTFGELRLQGEAQINTDENPDTRDIKAHIYADQYQLGFESTWDGTLQEKGVLDLSGSVLDGRLNAGPLRVSRLSGWSGLTVQADGYAIQTQLTAGSAAFMDLPLQNLSLAQESSSDEKNILLRAGVSGLPDMHFSIDYLENKNKEMLSAVLTGDNLANFLDFVEVQTGRKKDLKSPLLEASTFVLRADFQPDRRFVGGPLPFEIALMSDQKKSLSGNVLIYPDTMDARGALETDPKMATALKNYFKIPAEMVRQSFIRVDGNLRTIIPAKKNTKQP